MARKNGPSFTAIGITAIRAIESLKPESERLFYDPYAKEIVYSSFTGRFLFWLGKFYVNHIKRRGNGEIEYVLSRVRYIDDYLWMCLKDTIQQLVILGAGYDCRAYRFDDLKKIKVFEVDLPTVQQDKKTKLAKILGALPKNVIFVPVDFNQESLEKALAEYGYEESLVTLFIWEGVTVYISQEAADGVLNFVVNESGAGSSIIFDYPYAPLRHAFYSNNCAFSNLENDAISEYLEEMGFIRVINATSEDFRELYFADKEVTISPNFAIAHADVPSCQTKTD